MGERLLMRRRWLPVVIVAAGLMIAGIAAQGSGLQWGEREVSWESPTDQAEQLAPELEESPSLEEVPTAEEERPSPIPGWVSWLILGILVGIPLALVLYYLARRLLQWVVEPPDAIRPAEGAQYLRRDIALVEQAVEAGLAEIDLGTDPRSAIIACWVHFERASEAVGIPRESSDVPSDLTRRLLETHRLEGGSLERLSTAYLRARYSAHAVGEADRDSARAALVDLQEQLGLREVR